MLATQDAQVIPPIWIKHLDFFSLSLPSSLFLYKSLSISVSFTSVWREALEKLGSGEGSSELEAEQKQITVIKGRYHL